MAATVKITFYWYAIPCLLVMLQVKMGNALVSMSAFKLASGRCPKYVTIVHLMAAFVLKSPRPLGKGR